MLKLLVILSIMLMMLSSKAWSSWCDDVYARRVDYLRGTENIAVQVIFSHDSDQAAIKSMQQLTPRVSKILAKQIPKDSSVKIIEYSSVSGTADKIETQYLSSTTIFKFVIKVTKRAGFPLALANITLYLAKPGSLKEIAHKESLEIPAGESSLLAEFEPLTHETIKTIICLKDMICSPPKSCSDMAPIPARPKIKSEQDVLQFMESLENK